MRSTRLHDIPLLGNTFKRGVRAFAVISAISCLSACSGTISDPTHNVGGTGPGGHVGSGGNVGGVDGTGTGTGASATSFSCPVNTIEPGPAPLRFLTQTQYLNTVHDLLGDIPQLATVFDSTNAAVFGLQQGDVSQVALQTYQKAAELIATATVSNATKMKALAPCATGADKRGCARTFVQAVGSLG